MNIKTLEGLVTLLVKLLELVIALLDRKAKNENNEVADLKPGKPEIDPVDRDIIEVV